MIVNDAVTNKSRTAEHKRFKCTGKIMLLDVGGDLWWTDAYTAGQMLPKDDPITELLRWWNLPAEPGFYEVNGRVARDAERSDKLPDLVKLIPKKVPGSQLTRETVGDHPAVVFHADKPHGAWRLDDHTLIWLNDDFTKHLQRRHPNALLYGTDPMKPVYYVAERKVVAMQMPVRIW